ncbi:MAG: FAD:protein transferase [Frankiaceae bacterium]|jgi:thiamine biosynthesis lipoprotein|nr:FAD:protein transferase [Frankiaceae bacterium]
MGVVTTRAEAHATAAADRGWAHAQWRALGSSVELLVVDPAAMDAARDAVDAVLDAIDRAASRFRADSELTKLNEARGRRVDISPLFARALEVALDAARWTDGAVDPTVGASLLDAGYDRTYRLLPEDGPAITLVHRPAPGWQSVELDVGGGWARLPPGVRLDLGATAKGLASDLAAAEASEVTGRGLLVSLGGDVAVAGEAPAGGWPLRISDVADPALEADGTDPVVAISGGGLATSSTRARRWRRGGVELHHIIDPSCGVPAASVWRTVSVTAATCALANAASTAAVVIGEPAPHWLRQRGMPARLVRTDGSVVYVGGWPEDRP